VYSNHRDKGISAAGCLAARTAHCAPLAAALHRALRGVFAAAASHRIASAWRRRAAHAATAHCTICLPLSENHVRVKEGIRIKAPGCLVGNGQA